MNKSDLTTELSIELNLPLRKSEEIVDTVFDTLFNTLAHNNRIEIRGFGSFEVRQYEGYTGRNPKTGNLISVKDKRLPFFKAGKTLKEMIDRT